MSILGFITRAVKNAVIKGFEEAAEDLELTSEDQTNPLDALKDRMKPPAALSHEKPRKASKD